MSEPGQGVDQVLARVVDLERELQTPACRSDAVRLRQLLAPDFREVGASGRVWDLEGVLGLLAEESGVRSGVIAMNAVEARWLARGVVQIFWESERAGRRARRTSLWCEREGRWQQVYHQGTLLP